MGVTVKKDPTFVLWPIPVRMVELVMWKVARQNAVVSNVSAHILIHIVYTFTMVYIVFASVCVHTFEPCSSQQGWTTSQLVPYVSHSAKN